MSTFTYLFCYAALLIFVASAAGRIISYLKKPYQMRWELYPIPHEPAERFKHGGSYLEEVDWWKKERKHTFFGMAKYMAEEVLFLKACFEHNRPLWLRTYPFHLGLYLVIVFFALSVLNGICMLFGRTIQPILEATNFLGPLGMVLTLIGAAGIFQLRLTNEGLRKYSTVEQFFTLGVFIAISLLCLLTWSQIDSPYSAIHGFIGNLVAFNPAPIEHPLFIAAILMVSLLTAIIPNTHMAHFFMKYFLYHDIRWGDVSSMDDPKSVDKSLDIVLNYPVSWSAKHVGVQANRKTWVDVALYNPAAESEKK